MNRSTTIIDTNPDPTPATHEERRPAGDDAHDRALLRKYVTSGDAEALSALLLRHAHAAFRLACHFSANSHDAEDSVQVMALELMKNAEHFDDKRTGTVRLWIMGIVVNVCRRKRTENTRRAAREEKALGLRPAVVEPSVEGRLEQEQLQHKLKQAVGALPGLYRTPVSLHYYDGLSSGEIAAVLRIPENTIRSQLKRGIEQLRHMLVGGGAALSIVEIAKLAASTPLENAGQDLLTSLQHIARTGARPAQSGPSRERRARGRSKPGPSRPAKIVAGVAVVAALLLLLLLVFKPSFLAGFHGRASSTTTTDTTSAQHTPNSDRILKHGAPAPDAAQAQAPQAQQPRAVTETKPDLARSKPNSDTNIEENMKMLSRIKKSVATVALAALSWTAGARAADAAKREAPAPAPLVATVVPPIVDPGSPDVSGYVAIPDLNQTLEHLDVIARAFNPMLPPGMLKTQVGMQTGDPAFDNLDASRPVVVMALKRAATAADQTPSLAVFIPAKNAAAYGQLVTILQMVSTFQDGLLICAKTDDELKAAQAQVPAYKRIAADKGSADFRCYSSNNALLDAFEPKIQHGVNSLLQGVEVATSAQALPGSNEATAATFLKLEIHSVLEILHEIDSQQADITFKGDTLALDLVANSVKDSPLASLFVAPPDLTNNMHKLLVTPGLVQGILKVAPGSSSAFFQKLLERLSADPDFKAILTPDFKQYLTNYVGMCEGEWAMTSQFTAQAKPHNEIAVTVKDAKSAEECYERMAEIMKPDGTFGKLYGSTGLKMDVSVKKSVRQYKGVSIMSVKQNMDSSHAAGSLSMMSNLGFNMELAVVNNKVLVGASEPKDLEVMIDRAQGQELPAPSVQLEAITVFGPGKQFYFDYNVIEVMKEAMQAIPGNPMALVMNQMSKAKPIIGAGLFDHGRALVQLRVPLTPFIEVQTLMQKAQASKAQPQATPPGNGGNTEGKTDGKDEKF